MDFENLLQEQLEKLPFEKHLDDGGYNDGQVVGFEAGARWAFALFNTSMRSEQLVLFADWLQYNGKWDLPEKQVKNFLDEQKQN